ncbi:MAG: MFS transporter [Burkholderiales bacterium]|nr:MFS transporter [Burkholderiales bacterium]
MHTEGGQPHAGGLPYWELAGFYFFYFAFVGVISPYWSLYLKSLSFTAFEIGVLMSLLAVMRMFAPNVWGHLADRHGRRVFIVQIAALSSVIAFSGVFLGESFALLFVCMALLAFFWSASLPLVEATTLSHLGERTDLYGSIRLWGSVGFILSVVGVGYLLDYLPLRWLPWIVLATLVGVALFSRHIPEAQVASHDSAPGSVWAVLRKPPVMALIAACFLMSAAHGPYYTFYSIYLAAHGYSKSGIGWLWALGVLCEIGVFLYAGRLFGRLSLETVLKASFAFAVARFLIIAWGVRHPWLIVLAQTFHAATFGAYHASAIALVHRFFPGRLQARGQALYNSISFGAGGTLGSLYAGYSWDLWGPAVTYSLAAGCALLALLLLAWQLGPGR